MSRYISLHTLACLTRQGAEELAARLVAATTVRAARVAINLVEGKMLVEFETADRSTLERWLKEEGFHHEWILRVENEAIGGRLRPV